jgi:high-affinity iron transporter
VGTFIQALIIIVREGLEAMMLLTALAAYAGKMGRVDHLRAIYVGIVAAIAASIVLAWTFHSALATSSQTWVGGLLILGAAVLMLYVSGWLFIRRSGGRWQRYLNAKTEVALAQRAGYATAAVAFVAAFREGMEIVVFVFALASTGGAVNTHIAAGIIAGAIALSIVFTVIKSMTTKLPLQLVLAIKFIGDAVQYLQGLHYLPQTPIGGFDGLADFGINPTWEAVLAQLTVITISLTTLAAFERAQRSKIVI